MSRAFDEKKKARLFAINTYRNRDILESRHVSECPADMSFYEEMHKDMSDAIEVLNQPIETAMSMTKMTMEQLANYQDDLVLARVVGDCFFMTRDWDAPFKVRDRFTKERTAANIAEFVLSGKFKDVCESRAMLSDAAMAELNKDIYNRFYTLICRGIL